MENFRLLTFTLQFDYPDAYLLWDRAGLITKELAEIWPKASLEKAEPGVVQIRNSEAKVQIGLKTSYVNLIKPKSIGYRDAQISLSTKVWRSILEIENVTKIGMRAIYVREFPTRVESLKAFNKMSLIKRPSRDVFGCRKDSELNGGAATISFENELSLTTVRVYCQDLIAEVEQPDDFPEISGKKELHRVLIDIDRQTKEPVSADQIRAEDLLKGFGHLLNRDLPEVLYGG